MKKLELRQLIREEIQRLTDILNEDENPCWKGYKQIGMKKKGGNEVPNCVPESVVNGDIDDLERITDIAKPKFKIKHTITKKEWNKTHKNFKSIIDGVHYVMKLTDEGTALVPVNIEESVNEGKDPEIITQLRDVVKNGYKTLKDPKSGKRMKVDTYSASAIVKVYDKLSSSNKEKFVKQGLLSMQSLAFKFIK
jgi:hypothetical protein